MFLIQKIVRGKKMLSQLHLEQQQKSEDDEDEINGVFYDRDGHRYLRPDDLTGQSSSSGGAQTAGDTLAAGPKISLRRSSKRRVRRSSSLPSNPDAFGTTEEGGAAKAVIDVDDDPSIIIYRPEPDLSRLTPFQKRAIRFTWTRMKSQSNTGKKIDVVMEEVFGRMLRKCTDMREMFFKKTFLSCFETDTDKQTMTIKSHAKFTVQMLDHIITHIDRKRDNRLSLPEMFDPKIIGAAHQCLEPLGFSGHYWELFGEALTDEMFTRDAIRDMPGAPKAWVALAACLVDLMRAGFESRHNKSLRRKSTFTYSSQFNSRMQSRPRPLVVPKKSMVTANRKSAGESPKSSSLSADAVDLKPPHTDSSATLVDIATNNDKETSVFELLDSTSCPVSTSQ